MTKICAKCGREFTPTFNSKMCRQKYCLKCQRKQTIPTQEQLAKRAKRNFIDKVEEDSYKADITGKSYGLYMAEKSGKGCNHEKKFQS